MFLHRLGVLGLARAEALSALAQQELEQLEHDLGSSEPVAYPAVKGQTFSVHLKPYIRFRIQKTSMMNLWVLGTLGTKGW